MCIRDSRIGENGEILTRSASVMKGYFRNEAATAQAITDGWFHTGDVGRLDEEGALFITDRLKALLVTAGGKKVAPQPLEASLKTSKFVSEVFFLIIRLPSISTLDRPTAASHVSKAKTRGWSY